MYYSSYLYKNLVLFIVFSSQLCRLTFCRFNSAIVPRWVCNSLFIISQLCLCLWAEVLSGYSELMAESQLRKIIVKDAQALRDATPCHCTRERVITACTEASTADGCGCCGQFFVSSTCVRAQLPTLKTDHVSQLFLVERLTKYLVLLD